MSHQELPVFTWEEIQKHTSDTDCWVVLYDRVLDVTDWLNQHPGGLDPIKDMGGMDITNSFESIGHSSTALVRAKQMTIGTVDVTSKKVTGADKVKTAAPKWSETSREELLKYKAGGDIIPPWVIAAAVALLIALIYMFW